MISVVPFSLLFFWEWLATPKKLTETPHHFLDAGIKEQGEVSFLLFLWCGLSNDVVLAFLGGICEYSMKVAKHGSLDTDTFNISKTKKKKYLVFR